MNPNNSQISNTINGSTINGGNVAIGNNGNINQTNNNYITHQNSNEHIAVFGKLSIYLKSHKRYQDFDPYIPFSCIAKITENETSRSTKYTLFTGFLYLYRHSFTEYNEYNYSYGFFGNNENYLLKIFSNMIRELKNTGFYFKEETEESILNKTIEPILLSSLKSTTNSEDEYFLNIHNFLISIDKTKYTSMYNASINTDNISINQKILNESLVSKPRPDRGELIEIHWLVSVSIIVITIFIAFSQYEKQAIPIIIGMIILLKVLGFITDLINHIYKTSND